MKPVTSDPLDTARVETWIEEAQAGDARAFNHLIDRYAPLLYPLAYRHCGNAEDAGDCCQEAWLNAWRSIDGFHGAPDALHAWLTRIVINVCRDRMRYEMRRPSVPLELEKDGDARGIPLPDPSQSAEAYAESQDLAALMEACIVRLSPEQREVLLLSKAEFNYAEIGEILEIELGTVKSRMSRARARMRDLLRGHVPIGSSTSMEPERALRRSLDQKDPASSSTSNTNSDPTTDTANVKPS